MIDTIKISYKITDSDWVKLSKKYGLTEFNNGIRKAVINPTNLDKKSGIYRPKITIIKRPSGGGMPEILMEFSAPKLLFGNNFDELSSDIFPAFWEKIRKEFLRLGFSLTIDEVKNLEVRKADFYKNIPLNNLFPSFIISHISKGNFPLNKDIQKTDFRNGSQILHIHTNSVDIAIYDKISDLKQSIISEKRAFENNYYCQKPLSEIVEILPQILRFEVRINSSKQLKKEFNTDSKVLLGDIFASRQAISILLRYWEWILKYTPKSQIGKKLPVQ